MTGEPRTLQVHFKCATDSLNVIASVKEKSTCKYILVFYTPLICNHPQVSQCTCFTGTKVQMRALAIEEYEDTYNARTIAGFFLLLY